MLQYDRDNFLGDFFYSLTQLVYSYDRLPHPTHERVGHPEIEKRKL